MQFFSRRLSDRVKKWGQAPRERRFDGHTINSARSQSPFLPTLAVALVFTMILGALPAAAETACQQVWLISTRGVPRCGDLEGGVAEISYQVLDPAESCRWLTSDAKAFHDSSDAAIPTTVFIHGNHIEPDVAIEEGWSLYLQMREQAACHPFRLVIWSWPSERVGLRGRPDALLKACWSDDESYLMARVLSSMKPGVPLCLIGYSFGARTVGGTLELLAGGQIDGRRLSPEALAVWTSSGPRPIRAMLVAAAMDADWLSPSHRDGQAVPMVQRVLVTENGKERALRFYPHMYGRHGPQALGRYGPIDADCGKIDVVEVSREVGRRHNWYLYSAAAPVVDRLAWYTFTACDSAPNGPDGSSNSR